MESQIDCASVYPSDLALLTPQYPYVESKGRSFSPKSSGGKFRINNRRYLGSKYRLLPFIRKVVEENTEGVASVADIFAGTGVVASAFSNLQIITNDVLYSSYICCYAWFDPSPFSQDLINNKISFFNRLESFPDNYMSQNFSDTYFSADVCRKIGTIRQAIEDFYLSGEINLKERAILITSLLYAMDRIANTCGHYDAYRKDASFDRPLVLKDIEHFATLNPKNQCFNTDASKLVIDISPDLVYIDPPYNSRQYCDLYHLLENVSRWECPLVAGVARKMNRDGLKSDFCTNNATGAFERLISNINSKYIIVSYNNMAQKGNERSNARISDSDVMKILSTRGRVRVFSEPYRSFTTGKSNITGNQERLFLCDLT